MDEDMKTENNISEFNENDLNEVLEDQDAQEGKSSKNLFKKEKTIKLKESEHKKLTEELSDYKDKYYRLAAEFENARKRMDRDRQEFVKYANADLIEQFLNILDDLERTFQAAEAKHQDYQSFLKGIEMVMVHVHDMLKKNNVKPIEAKGKPFDPNCHEILMQEESNDVKDGTVLEEFQKGYSYGDRIVRTAKVKVATSPKSTSQSEELNEDETDDVAEKDK